MSTQFEVQLTQDQIIAEIEDAARRRGWDSAGALVADFRAGRIECPSEYLYILSLAAMLDDNHPLHVDL